MSASQTWTVVVTQGQQYDPATRCSHLSAAAVDLSMCPDRHTGIILYTAIIQFHSNKQAPHGSAGRKR